MRKSNLFKTPILFIIFNRPETEKRVFEQIRKIKPKYLFVAADGPRKDRLDDIENCRLAREIVDKGVDWDCEVKKLYRDENLGCKYAVSGAIDWFFENVEEGIILEDDCLPDLSFFKFCKDLLEKYRNNTSIMHISGDNFQPIHIKSKYSYYFSKYPNIWGWATWKRAWITYRVDLKNWRSFASKTLFSRCGLLERIFWTKCFDSISENKIDTWDCQWLFNVFNNGGVAIIPKCNLVENLGFESNATHYVNDKNLARKCVALRFPLIHPHNLNVDKIKDTYSMKNVFRINILSVLYHYFNETFLYSFLDSVRLFLIEQVWPRVNFILSILFQLSSGHLKFDGDPVVRIRIWGENLWMPFKHSLPIYTLKYKYYSKNLQRISHFLYENRGIYIVLDVGANIGDSVCLIKSKTPQLPIYCFEGNEKYLRVLDKNISKYRDVSVVRQYLGDRKTHVGAKVLSEGGSGMIVLKNRLSSRISINTIDNIVDEKIITKIGLIKIDTDGFDGKIIRGSKKTLTKNFPVLYFELDKVFYEKCGDSIYKTMKYLVGIGYRDVLVYDNYGLYMESVNLPQKINERYVNRVFSSRKAEYFDLIVFHTSNSGLFRKFQNNEKLYFNK